MRNPRHTASDGIPTGRELIVPVFRDLPGTAIAGGEMPHVTHRFAMDRESTGGICTVISEHADGGRRGREPIRRPLKARRVQTFPMLPSDPP